MKQGAKLADYTLTSDFNVLKKTVSTIQSDISGFEGAFDNFVFDYVPNDVLPTLASEGEQRLRQGLKVLQFTLQAEQSNFLLFTSGDSVCTGFQTDLLAVLYGVEETIESAAYISESLGRIGLALAEVATDLDSTPLGADVGRRGWTRHRRDSRFSSSGSLSQGAASLCPDVTPPPPLVHLDPTYFMRRLGIDPNPVNEQAVCTMLFPAHEVLRALGERQFNEGKCAIPSTQDQAKCVIDPFQELIHNLSAATTQARDTFYALECQIDHEVQEGKNRLCTAIAHLANQTDLDPNGTTKAGWEHWQGYANILKAGGGLAQQIGTVLQGIGDVSIDGVSLGASVAVEGDIRSGIDYANAIGKNLARIGGDAVWLGEEIDKMIGFCRGSLNLKLMICMLQQNKPQDYDECYQGVLDPSSADQEFGF